MEENSKHILNQIIKDIPIINKYSNWIENKMYRLLYMQKHIYRNNKKIK